MRILVADDCPVTRLRLKKNLTSWGYQPVLANDGKQALDALTSRYAPRLAVLDWMMPQMDGPTVAQHLRKEEFGPYTYIIMLTAKSDSDDLVSAFATGIDDFLTKPFNDEELHQRIRAGQRILNLHDKLNQTLESLKFQATHDSLTGLWNRRAILDALARELDRTRRHAESPSPTSVVLLDLDRFKSVNDKYGHQAGDEALKAASAAIRKSLRSYDYVGRYGGEEFIILLPSTNQEQAEMVVERMRSNIENALISFNGKRFQMTASMGVVTATDNWDVEQLVKQADEALFRAKTAGRNQYVFATEPGAANIIKPSMPHRVS